MSQRIPLIALVVVFAVLQIARPVLLHEWVWLGLGGALCLIVVWLSSRKPGALRAEDLGVLVLVAYLVHQFEEHGIDCLGRSYAFLAAANQLMGPLVGCQSKLCPLTEEAVFFVNTLLVWWPLALAALFGRRSPVLVAMAAGLPAANAVSHVVPALLGEGYNPGLVSGVLVFVPVVAITWRQLVRDGLPLRVLALAFVWGGLGHALLLGLSILVYVHGMAPGAVYGAAMLAWGSIPLFVAWRLGPRAQLEATA